MTNVPVWCERCHRKTKYPGADYGMSHYFCEDCLAELELEQNYEDMECRDCFDITKRGHNAKKCDICGGEVVPIAKAKGEK